MILMAALAWEAADAAQRTGGWAAGGGWRRAVRWTLRPWAVWALLNLLASDVAPGGLPGGAPAGARDPRARGPFSPLWLMMGPPTFAAQTLLEMPNPRAWAAAGMGISLLSAMATRLVVIF